jgi:hypothetical protein
MRAAFWLVAVGIAGFAVWHHLSHSDPSSAQVEPLLRDYLESERCAAGVRQVTKLDSVSVGAYVDQFGGWPVYADHVEECRDGGLVVTNDGSKDAERKVAVAFARRSSTGRVELFVPEIFAQGQREMNETFQKAFDNVKVN